MLAEFRLILPFWTNRRGTTLWPELFRSGHKSRNR